MANTKSTQHEIDLTSSLNLNKFKADIKPYEGFNERNSPYYGGCLSPLYIRDAGTQEDGTKLYDGHSYCIKQGTGMQAGHKLLQRDEAIHTSGGETLATFDPSGFVSTDISLTRENLVLRDYYDDNNYIFTGTESYIIRLNGVEDTQNEVYVNSYIYVSDSKSYAIIELPDNKARFFMAYNNTIYSSLIDFTPSMFNVLATSNYINIIEYTVSDTIYVLGQIGGVICSFDTTNNTIEKMHVSHNVTVNLDGDETIFDNISGYPFLLSTDKISIVFFGWGGSQTYGLYTVCNNPVIQRDALGHLIILCNIDTAIKTEEVQPVIEYTARYKRVHIHNNPIAPFIRINTKLYSETYSESRYLYSCYFADGVTLPALYSQEVFSNYNNKEKLYSFDIFTLDSAEQMPCPAGGFVVNKGNWQLLYNNEGIVQGISYDNTLVTPWLSISDDHNIYTSDTQVVYYDGVENKWVRIKYEEDVKDFTIIGDYIVVNTTSYLNAYRISDGSLHHWGNNWNNRINICNNQISNNSYAQERSIFPWIDSGYLNTGYIYSSNFNDSNNTYLNNVISKSVASAINPNLLEYGNTPLPSAIFAPITTYVSGNARISFANAGYGTDYFERYGILTSNKNEDIGIYLDGIFASLITGYDNSSSVLTRIAVEALDGTQYPAGKSWLNIPILFEVRDSVSFDFTLVKISNAYYQVLYVDKKLSYQYTSTTQILLEDLFVIQGQPYGIKDNKIYSLSFTDNILTGMQSVAPIKGLQYVASTIYNAYFYSPIVKVIYSFSADNNLTTFSQADTFTQITGASYIPSTGSILIGVNEVKDDNTTGCLYVLNEQFGIYRINEIKGFIEAQDMYNNCIGCLTNENKFYEIAYEPQDFIIPKKIILDTAYYGAGSNVVSVNDTWYVRVVSPEHEDGTVKLSVSTLTDIGRQTEERTFKIRSKDWDEITDTFYIRFQPKLQRAVGVSLHIESSFKIGYIGVGATPETLQLTNKGSI